MNSIDPRILKFIHKHHVFTLATAKDNHPYVCSCFYSYSEKLGMLLFTSDLETRHGQEMLNQQQVAASIALETQIIGKIQGIQLTGKVYRLSGKEYDIALKNYLLRFPYAGFKDLILWGIVPDFIKMTHNQLGFGKKLIWTRE